jgi:hypothetical protein
MLRHTAATQLIEAGVDIRWGSSYWKIPLSSVLACEERREQGRELVAEWSRDLDAMGAPPE